MLTHLGTPVLRTARLLLRPYRADDYQAMYDNWAGDPEVTRHLTWQTHASPQDTKAVVDMWVESYISDTVLHWGITYNGVLIGDIAVVKWNEEHESCEIGYCLSRAYWRQGIMTEALGRVLAHLFDDAGFHRVVIRHLKDNAASGRVIQKCGLQYEGTARGEQRDKTGAWADICTYAMLSTDRQAGKAGRERDGFA